MAGYTVTALALDQNEPTSRYTIAVSVMDNNGLGIQNSEREKLYCSEYHQ